MVLGWEEIKKRAIAFSKDFENETSEQAEAQTFWNEFFVIFGRKRRRVASFEKKAVLNGSNKDYKKMHIDNIKNIVGKHRILD